MGGTSSLDLVGEVTHECIKDYKSVHSILAEPARFFPKGEKLGGGFMLARTISKLLMQGFS